MNDATVMEPRADAQDHLALAPRADLLYCLAQAFLPPPSNWSICDWSRPLEEDLGDLQADLPELDLSSVITALASERARWSQAARSGGSDSWLVEYSRLFLVPPVAVTLNTGVYLEGALGGSSSQMMLACYEIAGVKPDERFHDLPDHVAMQLEFLARLHERAARGDADALGMAQEFAAEFVHAWGGPVERACRKAAALLPAAAVFAALARAMRQAVGDPVAV